MPSNPDGPKAWYDLSRNATPGQQSEPKKPQTPQEEAALRAAAIQMAFLEYGLDGAQAKGEKIGYQKGVDASQPKTFTDSLWAGFTQGFNEIATQTGKQVGQELRDVLVGNPPPGQVWGDFGPSIGDDLKNAGSKAKEGGKKAAKVAKTVFEVGKVVATDPGLRSFFKGLGAWFNRPKSGQPNASGEIIDVVPKDPE